MNLVEEVKQLAASVKATGQPAKMRPLNSYFRRLVHTAALDDPEIMTWSPPEPARLKRVTLMVREASGDSGGTCDVSITGESYVCGPWQRMKGREFIRPGIRITEKAASALLRYRKVARK